MPSAEHRWIYALCVMIITAGFEYVHNECFDRCVYSAYCASCVFCASHAFPSLHVLHAFRAESKLCELYL